MKNLGGFVDGSPVLFHAPLNPHPPVSLSPTVSPTTEVLFAYFDVSCFRWLLVDAFSLASLYAHISQRSTHHSYATRYDTSGHELLIWYVMLTSAAPVQPLRIRPKDFRVQHAETRRGHQQRRTRQRLQGRRLLRLGNRAAEAQWQRHQGVRRDPGLGEQAGA